MGEAPLRSPRQPGRAQPHRGLPCEKGALRVVRTSKFSADARNPYSKRIT